MLDVGFSEILLTSAIALIVLGPERLPKVARQVGNWMGRARAMARQLSEQLEREVNAEELLKTQSKSTSGTGFPASSTPSPHSDAAFDSPYIQSAPQPAIDPPSAAPAPAAVPAADAPAADAPPPVPREPDPVFGGLPPSATTPAAMHAADPPVAASRPPHE
jgi:sec-independent protein translocase protein TatB